MSKSVSQLPESSGPADSVDAVLITEELERRPSRAPDHASENRALLVLAGEMAERPEGLLQKLVELARELCGADSAGVSLLDEEVEHPVFRWHAVAGVMAQHTGGVMPRNASPCGTVLDRRNALLFDQPARFFTAARGLQPPIYEALLVPFGFQGKEVGTLWVIAHRPGHCFDAEDQRRLESLSKFASAGWSLIERSRLEERLRSGRTEALHLMEDALTARKELRQALEQTERAREQAEAAGRAKDHFLAVLSHELRTPLTPVLMATRLLSVRKDLPLEVQPVLEMIQRNVQLEARLIDGLLDLTCITHGKMEFNCGPMDLHTAVLNAVQVVDSEIQDRRQQLVIALEAPEHQVRGDMTRLQQVFWNLLRNASKFSAEAGEIRLSSRNEAGRIIVELSDSGIGFEQEAAARIFTAFTQASNNVTRQFGGLGLGLAISKASVEAHEGVISAWSAGPRQGATFTVNLPLFTS